MEKMQQRGGKLYSSDCSHAQEGRSCSRCNCLCLAAQRPRAQHWCRRDRLQSGQGTHGISYNAQPPACKAVTSIAYDMCILAQGPGSTQGLEQLENTSPLAKARRTRACGGTSSSLFKKRSAPKWLLVPCAVRSSTATVAETVA